MGELKQVSIATDGACLGNPGPGGYGVVLRFGAHTRELSAGYVKTTNNRMELRGAIAALAALTEACRVALHSDSQYLVEMMAADWLRRWRANGWKRADKKPVVSRDLWEELLVQCQRHEVTFTWVKGRAVQ